MAKRFTDTNKWRKGFVRGLQGAYKLLWLYIIDECDHAGIWHVEIDVAELRIGMKISTEDAIKEFDNHIVIFDEGNKWFIPDFIDFQYGTLNPENRAHKSVLNLLEKYKIKGHLRPLQGCKDMDKEKDKGINYNILVEKFNEYCSKMSKILSLTDIRKSHINARVEEHDFDTIINVFKIAGESDFLNGVNDKQWKATFDWLLKPTNFVKVLEGNYNNKERLQMMV